MIEVLRNDSPAENGRNRQTSQDSRCVGRDTNRAPNEYKSGADSKVIVEAEYSNIRKLTQLSASRPTTAAARPRPSVKDASQGHIQCKSIVVSDGELDCDVVWSGILLQMYYRNVLQKSSWCRVVWYIFTNVLNNQTSAVCSLVLKMDSVSLSKTAVTTFQATRRHNPEDQNMHLHRRPL
jgi:hypothetical protein